MTFAASIFTLLRFPRTDDCFYQRYSIVVSTLKPRIDEDEGELKQKKPVVVKLCFQQNDNCSFHYIHLRLPRIDVCLY